MSPARARAASDTSRTRSTGWLVGLLLVGGLLGLAGGWLALDRVGVLPRERAARPSGPPVAPSPLTPTPAGPRGVPAVGAPTPGEIAARYLAAWTAGNHDAMYDLLAPAARQRIGRAAFRARYQAIWDEAMIVRLEARPAADADRRAPSQPFLLHAETARTGAIDERNTLPFVLTAGEWGVDWSPSLIFADLRPGDRVQLAPETPTRGRIFDRNGQLLAQQAEMATIGVAPAELADAEAALDRLAAALGLEREAIRQQVAAGRGDWFVPLARRPWRAPPANLLMLQDLPGVEIRVSLERAYPLGTVAAHVLGYVREIGADEAARWRDQGYRPGEWIGAAGVEASEERALAGERGGRLTIVAADGATWRVLAERRARPARDVYLALDLPLQRAAEAALGERTGAVVGVDPTSGAVRVLASRPTFDPNLFVQGTSAAVRALLADEQRMPLRNRATGAAYPPAELFSVVTAAAAMEVARQPADAPLDCPAGVRAPGRSEVWRNARPVAAGPLTLRQALTQGCATALYQLALRVHGQDPAALSEMARRLGLGTPTGIAGLVETGGAVPRPADRRAGAGDAWTAADAIGLAAGGDGAEVTPLQIARLYGALVNGGVLWTPRLVERVGGGQPDDPPPAIVPDGPRLPLGPGTLSSLRSALLEQPPAGDSVPAGSTAMYHQGSLPVGLAATAATGVGGMTHAWFAGYAPADQPRLALAVLIERGGNGAAVAAPIGQEVLTRGLRPGVAANLALIHRLV